MTLLILIEAFKIHKVKQERRIQMWFLFLYLINVLPHVLPVGDKNFDALFVAYEAILSGQTTEIASWQLLTPGNWLFLGIITLTYLMTAFFTLMYAVLYVSERNHPVDQGVLLRCLNALPRLIALTVIIAIPAMMSAFLAFIPFIIFAFMVYFLPLKLAVEQKKLFPAMQESYEITKGKKLSIFIKVFLLSFILSVPQGFLTQLVADSDISYAVLNTFFVVIRAFMQGRLMGILYLQLVKKVPFVIPSKSDISGQKKDEK